MWIVTIRSPWHEPREHVLRAGKTTLGRKADNDIVIADESASRLHAVIEYNAAAGILTLRDLDSTNGTYVNRDRLTGPLVLSPEDQIRIGQHLLILSRRSRQAAPSGSGRLPATQPLTRDLVLESVDQHALVLYEVATRLNTILDLNLALLEVSNLARVALGASRCEVLPIDRFDRLAELGFPTHIAHQALTQRSVVFLPDLAAGAAPDTGPAGLAMRIRSVVCVPGMMGEDVVALTFAYRTGPDARPFDQQDVQLAIAISHQAALTIQRTQLLDKARRLEELATADPLTELHNRRHFFELGDAEFARARRYRRPLAAMMFDIDDFKKVNDRHGHLVGDQVLRTVARRCRESLREPNLIGRYGGDEFVVLLLECGLLEAERVAERLRRRVAEPPIDTDAGPINVTISTGCTVMAEDCANLHSLIALADAALYLAKRARPTPAA